VVPGLLSVQCMCSFLYPLHTDPLFALRFDVELCPSSYLLYGDDDDDDDDAACAVSGSPRILELV
jgi:hypothetical protein